MAKISESSKIVFCIPGKDIHIHYDVRMGYRNMYLNNCEIGGSNSEIFKVLHLPIVGTCDSAYGYRSAPGDWPEARRGDFEAFDRVVSVLARECTKHGGYVEVDGLKWEVSEDDTREEFYINGPRRPLKVGDLVRIRPIFGKAEDYPGSYICEMQSEAGKLYRIQSVSESFEECYSDRKYYTPWDPSVYRIESNMFSWCRAELEFVEEDCPNLKTCSEGEFEYRLSCAEESHREFVPVSLGCGDSQGIYKPSLRVREKEMVLNVPKKMESYKLF